MKPKTKLVRVDSRTLIQVPLSKPSDEARREYLLKIEENRRKFDSRESSQRWKF